MERRGDDIEREMAGVDQELAQLGDKVGKGFAQKFGKDFAKSFGPQPGHDSDDADDDDDDDKDAVVVSPDIDRDPADMGPAIAAIRGIALDQGQRDQLARLRAESEAKVQQAKRELEAKSSRLRDRAKREREARASRRHAPHRNASASEDHIARQIEAISQVEATIRKARILTWVKARNVLRKDQRKLVEQAVE